jgi:hypothetical protein
MSGIIRANNTGQSGIVTNTETIDSDDYVDGSIDNAHIADNAIDSEHYTDGSIDNAHLADDAVDSDELAAGAVDTAHIGNLQVTTAKIAGDAINGTKLADDAVDSEHYTDGSIDTAHIADNQVTLAKMAGITRGSIIVGDSSGDPAALAIGGNTYVLTSDATDISWAAASSGPTEASATNMLNEATGTYYAPPDLIKYSPGVAKVWAKWNSGSHASLTYNMSGLTDGSSAAETDHAFDDDFTSVDYAFVGSALDNGSFVFICGLKDGTDAAGGMTTINRGADTGTADLNDVSMSIHGIQVV